jgi:P4 family phage/plasmid primase-like protien
MSSEIKNKKITSEEIIISDNITKKNKLLSDQNSIINFSSNKNVTVSDSTKKSTKILSDRSDNEELVSESTKKSTKILSDRSDNEALVSDSITKKNIILSEKMSNNLNDNNLNELERLYKFMTKYRNENKNSGTKNLPWTHAMTYEPYGSYNIPDNMDGNFIKLYEDAIVAGYVTYITEKHREFGPIVIDLDFVQSKEHSKRYYSEITIMNIIKLYNYVIRKYLKVTSHNIISYVLEKEKPSMRKGEYHDGIHIIYPYICTKPSLQMIMRDDFLKLANEYRIFKKIPLVNNLESVFDKSVIYNTGWLLYGSTKDPCSQVYRVTHIYHIAGGKIGDNGEISNESGKIYDILCPGENLAQRSYIKHFVNVLRCRRYSNVKDITPLVDNIDPNWLDEKIGIIKKKIVEGNNPDKEIAALMGNDVNFVNIVEDATLNEARNLTRILSKERATNYHTWYQVGKCLYNIDYRLLGEWIEFSKKCPEKFKKGECEKLWGKMKRSNYTIATLHYFASIDDPEHYQEMKREKIEKLVRDGLEASHHTIARLLMEKYKLRFKCASIKHSIWYEFRNHRWIEIDSAHSLRDLISKEIIPEYINQQQRLYNLAKDTEGYEKNKYFEEACKISSVIKHLNNNTFRNGVIKECEYIAYDPKFLENLDENIYLICFENGVYDLEADIFRNGCPDDYISLCTNYDYIEYNKDDEITKEIKDFMRKIQPDKKMRRYLLMLLSTCLSGSISEESFYVLTGSGANGKSKLMELLRYTLGDLFKPMDIRLLTEKRSSSSSASPELADKKGIRACPLDEPKANDEINTGFMKIFTGGDLITARALFKEPIYFKPQFKPFLLCNHLPNIRSDDDGTWRRLMVIHFPSKFIKPSEATEKIKKNGLGENQFWADEKLSEKLPNWKQLFMGMLIRYYRKYKKEGLNPPELVTYHTKEYRRRCDIFQDFISDYLEKTNDTKDSVSVSCLHEGMRNWYRSNYDGRCPPTKDLRNYLLQRIPSYNQKTDSLIGYRVKKNTSDDILDDLVSVKSQ